MHKPNDNYIKTVKPFLSLLPHTHMMMLWFNGKLNKQDQHPAAAATVIATDRGNSDHHRQSAVIRVITCWWSQLEFVTKIKKKKENWMFCLFIFRRFSISFGVIKKHKKLYFISFEEIIVKIIYFFVFYGFFSSIYAHIHSFFSRLFVWLLGILKSWDNKQQQNPWISRLRKFRAFYQKKKHKTKACVYVCRLEGQRHPANHWKSLNAYFSSFHLMF